MKLKTGVFIKGAGTASSLSSQSSAAAPRFWVAEAVCGGRGGHQPPLERGQRIPRLRCPQLALSTYRQQRGSGWRPKTAKAAGRGEEDNLSDTSNQYFLHYSLILI